jgi:putative transposase
MILAHHIALDPTVEQSIALSRACGCARFTWNWALAEWGRRYEAGEKPTANRLKAIWNKTKRAEFPWIKDSPKDANQQPFTDLGKAFNRFFSHKARYPRFKRKGVHDSFYVSNDKFRLHGKCVRLPVIGELRLREALRYEGRIVAGVVSREAHRWFISIQVDVGAPRRQRRADGDVGVDLGIKTALVTSDGQTFEAPKPLKRHLRRLRRASKAHARKVRGSNNRKKAGRRLARMHARIKAIRRDWTHKVTTRLCRENQTIVLEDLNVKGMLANHCLARAISDVGFREIRRQLEYKAPIYGARVIVIDRWAPTSKTCSGCGHRKDRLGLAERVFRCAKCGAEIDRDLNASINILAAGLAVSACGSEGSGSGCEPGTKPCGVEAGTKPGADSHPLTN